MSDYLGAIMREFEEKLYHQSPCKVLIVEDEGEVSAVLSRYLAQSQVERRIKFEISITDNIIEAVKLAERNSIDIFIVDLGLDDPLNKDRNDRNVGLRYVPVIASSSDAGIIIYSSEEKNDFFEQLLKVGVDDYIQKSDPYSFVVEKVIALWRRIISVRREVFRFRQGHIRTFLVGQWRFTVGDKVVINESGQKQTLSITEHELLKHLVLSDGNSIDQESISAFVLKRPDYNSYEVKKSIENLIYRLRKKFGDDIILHSGGMYTSNLVRLPL
jgi:DNA-binding response OmpR family regulator